MLYLLLFYIFFLLIYSAYSVVAIYHLRRFGFVGDHTKLAILLYSFLSIAMIAFSFVVISSLSWGPDFNI